MLLKAKMVFWFYIWKIGLTFWYCYNCDCEFWANLAYFDTIGQRIFWFLAARCYNPADCWVLSVNSAALAVAACHEVTLLLLLWSPYGIGQTIIFLPCGLFYFVFLSSPNLSRRRLDVCHTSSHCVALVRISDAGLKRAACGSLKIQDVKNRQKIAFCAPSHNFVRQCLSN